MNQQTEIIRSHESDKVTRVEVQCSLGIAIPKPLRDYELGTHFNRQLYILGTLIIVAQTPYGFLLKTEGRVDSASLESLVAEMQEQAQKYNDRLEFLKELGDDVKTVCRLGLGPELGTAEIAALGERVEALESLAQTAAEDAEPPDYDVGPTHDSLNESEPYPHELNEPPPAEPDRFELPGRSLDEMAQEFVDKFMDIFNRFGRYALAVTLAGLAAAAILRAAGVF